MTDEYTTPLADPPSIVSKVVDGIQSASDHVTSVIQQGRRPGKPLDILAQATRKSPIRALVIAFVLGVMFARR